MYTYMCMYVSVHVYVYLSVCLLSVHRGICVAVRGEVVGIVPFTLCIHGVGLGSSSLVVSTAEPSLWPLLGLFSK